MRERRKHRCDVQCSILLGVLCMSQAPAFAIDVRAAALRGEMRRRRDVRRAVSHGYLNSFKQFVFDVKDKSVPNRRNFNFTMLCLQFGLGFCVYPLKRDRGHFNFTICFSEFHLGFIAKKTRS